MNGKFHFYKQKAAKKRPNAHRGNPSADTIIPPMAEDELREVLKKDFQTLYVKEFTTDWEAQRFVRSLEIDVMSLDNLAAYTTNKIIEELEELLKTHKELGMWSNMREIVERELAELRKTL